MISAFDSWNIIVNLRKLPFSNLEKSNRNFHIADFRATIFLLETKFSLVVIFTCLNLRKVLEDMAREKYFIIFAIYRYLNMNY